MNDFFRLLHFLLTLRNLHIVRLPRLDTRIEHVIDLFKRPLCRLRIQEKHMKRHHGAEHPEDNVCFPLDVGERRGHKVRQCEVENPIAGSRKPDTFGTILQREYLG